MTTPQIRFVRALRSAASAALLLLLVLAGCDSTGYGDDEPDRPSATRSAPVVVPFFIADADGAPPVDPGAPLFETRAGAPILAPDGHHLTLAAFSTPQGIIEVDCIGGGTRVRLEMSGLIPNGVYTMWNAPFGEGGPQPDAPDFNLTGRGVVGAGDGSQSAFVASAAGTATYEATTPGGALSEFGTIGDCALTEEIEWHAVGAYHIDGQTHGPLLGPDGTAVEQFAFVFTTL